MKTAIMLASIAGITFGAGPAARADYDDGRRADPRLPVEYLLRQIALQQVPSAMTEP